MTKQELRKAYKAKRNTLSEDDILNLSLQIANRLLTLDIWNHSFYHIFLSIVEQKEVHTDDIIHILSGKDKNIVLSKSDFETGTMIHYLLTDATVLKKNSYNIPEPVDGIPIPSSKLEVVFVPLMAFDKEGHRIGYGKGFYDRFLADCGPDTVKIGLSFFEPEDHIAERFANDINLDYCVTPDKVYAF
ncbi:5-formyltetrahydrofolate cyclo-ligase [Mangrovimonas sp. ST2L15]|uniref:5-formyltetrahydrofolate cyclo-ligase n=1 Tax=Mangrovimonas sp. ST2L15 TaxID=1645916 RepID=UPI0006B5AEED|nr:5-formyltetrahydrofolate cyclo-ligase [Mangrovimonas sp. ST2L15]